jgi:DNA replication protein DnaC
MTVTTTTTTGGSSPVPSTRTPSPSTATSTPASGASSARRAGLSEQAAATAIEGACRTLHLPTIRDRAADAIAAAERGRHTYAALLAELLLAECDARDERRRARRAHEAGFPRPKRLEDFNTDANPNIHPATLAMLTTGDWVRTGTPVCLLGDSGTGKSHLLIGLGTAAAEAGYRVRYVLASRLVNELAEAENDRELTRVIARYGRVDLLCLDELGYLQLDRRGAELLFQVLTEREERNAIAIATNEPFSGWTKTFTDPRLCAAIVDRLTFNGHIIETGTTSYRLAHTRAHRT